MQATSPDGTREKIPPTPWTPLTSPVRQRFHWTGYLRQWQAVLEFYACGLAYTLRHGLSLGQRSSLTPEEIIQASRRELAQTCRNYFARLQRWGIMSLDDRALSPFAHAQGKLFAANHPGLFDAFFLLGRIPNLNCIMRASLLRDPCIRGGALRCGFIPNDTGADFVRQAVDRLSAGENLLIFPEGTRTLRPGLLNPFKGGLAMVAKKSGRPVQTIFIEVDQPVLGKKQSLFQVVKYPVLFRLRCGKEFTMEPGEKTAAFTARVQEYFTAEMQRHQHGATMA